MAETPPVRTTNGALQTQLEHWAAACATVAALPLGEPVPHPALHSTNVMLTQPVVDNVLS